MHIPIALNSVSVYSLQSSVCLSRSSADLTEVCDMEEDKAYVAKKCTELRSQYNQLEKIARDALEEILNKRTTSRCVLSRSMDLCYISITYE